MKCSKCGFEMKEGSSFCGKCRERLHQGETMMEYTNRVLAERRARKTTVRRKAIGNLT